MKIPLQDFENYIDSAIVKRGLAYYNDDCVSDLDDSRNGTYTANVFGSEEYEVSVSIKDSNITEHYCDCPYEYGDFCKHEVALLFYLRDEFFTLKVEDLSKKETIPKNKSKAVKIEEIIKKVSFEDLKNFIVEESKHNDNLKVAFVSRFLVNTGNDSKESYVSQLKNLFKSYSGRYSFIDYSAMRKLAKPLNDFIATIEKHMESGNIQTAIYMSFAMMEVGIKQIGETDDSNGELGACIAETISIMYQISVLDNHEDLKKQLWDFCLEKFDGNEFSGWDWHFEMLRIAEKLAKNLKEYDVILKKLEKGKFSEYWKTQAEDLKYKILLKIDKQKAHEFLYENIGNSDLREKAIDLEIRKFNYDNAINLCYDGIKYDEKERPGLVSIWYQLLLKIAKLTDDKPKIIEYSRWLFIKNFRRDEDYYQILKETVPKENWSIFVEVLIKEIKQDDRYRSGELIAQIYVKEKYWDKLMLYIKENPSVYKLEEYEKYLLDDYAFEISDLYCKAISKMLERASDRSRYQEACKYLKKIKKLGFKEKADQLVSFFQTTYPKRRALMEELEKV